MRTHKRIFSVETIHRPEEIRETKEHREWKLKVLNEHKITTDYLNNSIIEVKKTKKTVRKNIKEANKILGAWKGYQDEYNDACKGFEKKISMDDEEKAAKRMKFEEYVKLHTHYKTPTKCSIMKRQLKFKSSRSKSSHQ